MRKRCLVVVIVEDDRHEMLVRRYLKQCGMGPREIRIERSPSGRGSAEQWVRKTFIKETSVYRNRHAQTKLIVVIDADIHLVEERLRQLDHALTATGKPVVENFEEIARLIPKRNVETWILCLNENPVDEETDYKGTRHDWNDLIPQASQTLFQWTRPHAALPIRCTGSLRRGVTELNRLTF